MAATSGALDDLETYTLRYEEAPWQQAGPQRDDSEDQSIRRSDRYVDTHDPLRALALADGHRARVQLGVDPGTFFCGAQLAELLRRRRRVTPAELRVGFIHVPPDRRSGPQAQAKVELHGRTTNLAMIAQVVAIALRGVTPASDGALLLTGFGPFQGVADNPTDAFVRDATSLDRAIALAHPGAAPDPRTTTIATTPGTRALHREYTLPPVGPLPPRRLRLFSALIHLAHDRASALAGRYFSPDRVAASFEELVDACAAANGGDPPSAILSLGVDSSQAMGSRAPSFKIETQTRGWHRGESRADQPPFQRDLGLARVFMDARADGAAPLRYESLPARRS